MLADGGRERCTRNGIDEGSNDLRLKEGSLREILEVNRGNDRKYKDEWKTVQ